MKYILPLFILFSITIAACNNEKIATDKLEKTKLYAFSDSIALDTFKVALIGENSADMKFVFTIKSHNGKEIYKEEINTQVLLKSYLASEDLKKESEKMKFLTNEVSYFLDDEQFLEPAVTETEEPSKNNPDLAFYKELKESQLNGFGYRLGKDTKMYIAYSITEQKVKVYYKCC
ncbi:MAG: hypothetical protein EOO87_00730 [Pedobacter sp.]|nr:MAG: hypothetical protein EOO87_00730 [Pedobacter sp.]